MSTGRAPSVKVGVLGHFAVDPHFSLIWTLCPWNKEGWGADEAPAGSLIQQLLATLTKLRNDLRGFVKTADWR